MNGDSTHHRPRPTSTEQVPADTLDMPDGTEPPIAPPPVPGQAIELRTGQRPVPDYELVGMLGRGGFGEVWKAIGPGGFAVALKFLRLDDRNSAAAEIRSLEYMKSIHHPHLLATFGSYRVSGWLMIAMELGDQTLQQRFEQCRERGEKGIPTAELLEYMREAAKGIDHLNALGIQHRDIKPQNFLLVGGGLKVADFGLAKLLEASFASNSGSLTPAYAAPEFFQGQTSPNSDQYSLAVTYCLLRGGELPFAGNAMQMMFAHIEHEPKVDMLPAAERPVVRRALSKQSEDRWPSCRAFVQALAMAAGGVPAGWQTREELPPTTIYRPPGSQQRRRAALAATILLVGVLGSAGFLTRDRWMPLLQQPSQAVIAENGDERPRDRDPDPMPSKPPVASIDPEPPERVAPPPEKSPPKPEKMPTTPPRDPMPKTEPTKSKPDERPMVTKVVEKKPTPPPPIAQLRLARPLPRQIELRPGKSESFTVESERANLDAVPTVRVEGLPKGVTAKVTAISKDRHRVELTAPPGTADGAGKATVHLRAGDLAQSPTLEIVVRTPPLAREIKNSIGMPLVLVRPGKFPRGSLSTEPGRAADEGPVREIEISRPYYLGVHEVTQEQYRRVMGKNPSWFSPEGDGRDLVRDVETANLPVESVSWEEAVEFCRRLSQLEAETAEGRGYRLPTEAEWEYACRAGSSSRAEGELPTLGVMLATGKGAMPPTRPAAVGSLRRSNAWGLQDMHGNVFEWVQDFYDAEGYAGGDARDPTGPARGLTRGLRGGAWCYSPRHARAAARNQADPGFRAHFLGFRVALTAPAGPLPPP